MACFQIELLALGVEDVEKIGQAAIVSLSGEISVAWRAAAKARSRLFRRSNCAP